MLRAGLIRESNEGADPALDDSRRRYYALTAYGQTVLEAEVQRLEQAVYVARSKKALGSATIVTEPAS